ncbi:MAG: hypothetical protein HQ542_11615 [Bacteroidia bacterium]|nr:hypothetical protein [Bacteroidia bacterium]
MAVIIIARKHTSGNFTFAAFQVDLYCLGVKDSYCEFNMHPLDFQEYLDKFSEFSDNEVSLIETTYTLAHNIIYGAVEYAEELGFKPCKEFKLAQFILEDDDDRIELIDVEFGLDGKPAVIIGREDYPKDVLSHLDNTIGPSGYTLIHIDDLDDDLVNEYDFADEDPFDLDDESISTIPDDDDIPNYRDPEVQRQNLEKFVSLQARIKMVYGTKCNHPQASEIRKETDKINDLFEDKISSVTLKEIEKLETQFPDIPGFAYLKVRVLESLTKTSKYEKALDHYLEKFPEYPPFRYLLAQRLLSHDTAAKELTLLEPLEEIEKVWPETTAFCDEQLFLHIQLLFTKYTNAMQFHYGHL